MARAGFKRTVRRMRHRAARCAAPTSGRNPLRRAGGGTRPYEMGESSGFAVGADDLGGPLRGLCDSRAHPYPPRMRSAPSPQGEGRIKERPAKSHQKIYTSPLEISHRR